MKIMFDMEFTGLHQHTTLISLGIVSESGHEFYAELTDYDESQVDDWIRENVISKLSGDPTVKTTMPKLKGQLTNWLEFVHGESGEKLEVISDCMSYDWVLFNQIFGHAFNLPDCVHYIPTDICTMFRDRGIDPDITREDFVREYGVASDSEKHNALYDALVIKACYEKLLNMEVIKPAIKEVMPN